MWTCWVSLSFYGNVVQGNVAGQWRYREGGAGRLLLDVLQLEHPPGVQGGLHWWGPGQSVSQSVSQSPVCRLYFYVKWRSLLIKNMRVDLVLQEIHSISFFFIFSSRCITAYVLNPSYNVKKLFKITFCKLKVFDTELLRALSQR